MHFLVVLIFNCCDWRTLHHPIDDSFVFLQSVVQYYMFGNVTSVQFQ